MIVDSIIDISYGKGNMFMGSARNIYKEILRQVLFSDKLKKIENIEDIKIKDREEKKLKKEVEAAINNGMYRKLDACFRATYVSLGLKTKIINKIKNDSIYKQFKQSVVELCEMFSYDMFFSWLVDDWGKFYCISENDKETRIKHIEFYMEWKTIVFSVIKAIENESDVKRAQRMYRNSIKIYQGMIRETQDMDIYNTLNSDDKNDIEDIDSKYIQNEAQKLLIEYKKLVENIDFFNNKNYYNKSKYDDKKELKKIEMFFKGNRYRIDEETYSLFKEVNLHIMNEKNYIRENEKYAQYEEIIKSNIPPDVNEIFGDELDLLQRCRREYKSNPNIDIKKCIQRNWKIILEEKSQLFDNELYEDVWW